LFSVFSYFRIGFNRFNRHSVFGDIRRQAYQHCGSKKAALRRLANRWLSVLWKVWQIHTLYDERYQLQQRALRAKPRD
jgi:hypothetical protein